MNFSRCSLIAGCCLAALPATGFSATYICVQADGRKTYTDHKAEAEAKGCKEIDIRPNNASQRPAPRQGSAVAEPPRKAVAQPPPPQIQPTDWDAPPINFISGKSDGAVSPDDLYIALSRSVYELTSQAAGSRQIAYGSAIAVTSRHALTNCHIVQSSTNVLLLIQKDGGKLPGKLVGAYMDKCVVESTSADLAAISGIRSFASLREGERVYAIGNPRGLKRTISDGLLSGKREGKGVRVVQTTAPISAGSSGGGLFDSAGNLIGITTAFVTESQNLNIVIPAEDYWVKFKWHR